MCLRAGGRGIGEALTLASSQGAQLYYILGPRSGGRDQDITDLRAEVASNAAKAPAAVSALEGLPAPERPPHPSGRTPCGGTVSGTARLASDVGGMQRGVGVLALVR